MVLMKCAVKWYDTNRDQTVQLVLLYSYWFMYFIACKQTFVHFTVYTV